MGLCRECAVERGYAQTGARVYPRRDAERRAEREPVARWKASAMAAALASAKPSASTVMPSGRPSRAEARRNGDAAQAHQVDEVGVGAEPGIEQDRLGLDLGDAVDGRRGRHHEHVGAGQQPPGVALQLGQPVNGAIGVPRRPVARRVEDRPRRGVQGVLVAGDHRLGRDVALGQERRLVEEPLGLVEDGVGDLDSGAAEAFQPRNGGLEQPLGVAHRRRRRGRGASARRSGSASAPAAWRDRRSAPRSWRRGRRGRSRRSAAARACRRRR